MQGISTRSTPPSKFTTPDAALSIKEHLTKVADSLSTSPQSHTHILGVITSFDNLAELPAQDFTRLFDIQGHGSHLPIPGATSFHMPFPGTKPLTQAYAEWLDANIKRFHTWFDYPKIDTPGSMGSQILEAMLHLRTRADKKDEREFLKILEQGWRDGWLRKSLFVAFMIHMLSTVAEAARPRDPHLPVSDVLTLLVQSSLNAIFFPFLKPGSNIDFLMSTWYNPLELSAYLTVRILGGSEHLQALVDVDDLPKFGNAFRLADKASQINMIIDHCAQHTIPWTPAKTLSLLSYVHESAREIPASAGNIYAAVLQYIIQMNDMKTPGFKEAMKREIFSSLCQSLVGSAAISRAAQFALLNDLVLQIESSISRIPQSYFYKVFENTGLAIASPVIRIGSQSYPVSESLRSIFDFLKTKRAQLSPAAAAFHAAITERLAGIPLQPPSKL